jgi:hypothetical protein
METKQQTLRSYTIDTLKATVYDYMHYYGLDSHDHEEVVLAVDCCARIHDWDWIVSDDVVAAITGGYC